MLRVAVLGAGAMGRAHARAYTSLPDVEIAAIAATSLERASALASQVGAQPSIDPLALAADPSIDAISVALPTHLHTEYTIAALRAGKYVLLEKPMGLTLAECDAMLDADRVAGGRLMVAHVLRFWPEYEALVAIVRGGSLGAPVAAYASRLSSGPTGGSWFGDPALTGGAVHDLHIHDLDLFNWLFGTPRSVVARGQRGPNSGWDHVFTTVDFGGVSACAEASMIMPKGWPFTMTARVVCERGAVDFSYGAGGAQIESDGAPRSRLTLYETGHDPRPLPFVAGDAYQRQCAAFVECARAGRTPDRATAAGGRRAVQTALAARESIEIGQPVMVDDAS